MESYAGVLGETVFAGSAIEEIAVVREKGPFAVNAGVRRSLLPPAAGGLVEGKTNQAPIMYRFGDAGSAPAVPSALVARAGLRLELPIVVMAPASASLRSETGPGILSVRG